ncbi:MAG: glycosyl hydrolase [Actinomycetota bacterium]
MGARSTLIAAVATLAVAFAAAGSGNAEGGAGAEPGRILAKPPHGRVYHAAFPDFGGPESRVSDARIRSFERLTHRRIAWAYFSNNWLEGRIHFPAQNVRAIARAGRVPFIRMMARSGFAAGPDPNFKMRSIAAGAWDPELTEWCDRARDAGIPLLVEFGTEVNGDWFRWNGRWNGGGRTHGYGNPRLADGPESFRDAYRRIVDICRAEGANDITWFFHVDVGGWPKKPWNRIAAYYPGDAYVDWIGVSDYGPLKPRQPWVSFRRRLDRSYEKIAGLSRTKPIAVLEYGAAEDWGKPRRKARWIRRAIRDVAADRWPRVRALSYWHEQWQNAGGAVSDLHVDSSKRATRAYRRGVARRVFRGRPRFVSR